MGGAGIQEGAEAFEGFSLRIDCLDAAEFAPKLLGFGHKTILPHETAFCQVGVPRGTRRVRDPPHRVRLCRVRLPPAVEFGQCGFPRVVDQDALWDPEQGDCGFVHTPPDHMKPPFVN